MSPLAYTQIAVGLDANFVASPLWPQVPFALDTTFLTEIIHQNVNDILLLDDGRIIASGVMRFPGEISDKRLVALLPDGQRDEQFNNSGLGGGKLTEWQDYVYVAGALVVRRVDAITGVLDPGFSVGASIIPYFSPVQSGDYHVYPDGSVLISGTHLLNDTVRGFTGPHHLIWFTNTGYLDTTRTHRQAGGAVYRFAELPDGKFLCNGTSFSYGGQPVDRIFRIHPDGALDTTFQTGVYIGDAFDYLPLADGRVYIAGNYETTQAPGDTLRLARFLPDGSMDMTFTPPQFSDGILDWPYGASVASVHSWGNGDLLVTGLFQYVNGQPRRGICMVDSTGQLLDAFDDCGVDPFFYPPLLRASVINVLLDTTNNHLYLCGAYVGYDDGTTNDPLQRFVSRLHLGDIVTDVEQHVQRAENNFTAHPNPASSYVILSHRVPNNKATLQLVVRDLSGRGLKHFTATGEIGQTVWDTRGITPGVYTVELQHVGRSLETLRVVVQP